MCTIDSTQFNKKDIERLIAEKNTLVSYVKPKETAKTSKFWSQFSQVYVDKIKQDFIICDYCKSVLVYKSSTGSGCMVSHSRACQPKQKEFDSADQQQKINHYYKSTTNGTKKIPKRVKDAITLSYVEFVVQDARAFHLVEGSGFIRLAKQLFDTGKLMSSSTNVNIEDLLPNPTTVSRNVDRMYSYRKEQLIKLCRSMKSYCLIVDFWCESYTGLSYCGLALSHIDAQWKSNIFLLGCFPYELENKRASTIRSFIDEILRDFGLKLDQKIFVMSDNEPTMKCLFNLNCTRIGCSDHYLNKQLQHAFTTKKIDGQDVNCDIAQDMFDGVKHIVSSVRRMHKQQHLSKKLILYSETRFSGAYGMLNVFSNVFDELDQILDSKLLTIYSRIDKDLLYDICEFLGPFDTVLEALSDSKRPTLHRVLPFKQFLINKCNINSNDKDGLKELKIFLGKRIDEKWELSDEHLLATLIHPNLKHFHMCPYLKDRAIYLLKQEMLKREEGDSSTYTSTIIRSPTLSTTATSISCSLSSISTSITSSLSSASSSMSHSSSSTSASIISSSSARKSLLMEIFDKQLTVAEKTSVEGELEKYLSSSSVIQDEEEDDIFLYWREHQNLFPIIASIARDVLAIPASNTSIERLFSSCKNTITDKRTRLGAQKLNKLMFLQKNMDILKEKFGNDFIATNDEQDIKRKHDTINLNNQSIGKKLKPNDHVINYQNDDEHIVNIESEDDEQIN